MENNKWLAKDTFIYQDEPFTDDKTSREKLKKIEKIKEELSLNKEDVYMTLYATSQGVAILKHTDRDSAICSINNNEIYYKQLWRFDKEKGAFRYVAEYRKGKGIEI